MTVLQGSVLWKIGEPDGDYREFALAGRYGEYLRFFPDGVRFRVGQSKLGEHWCYIHPGPADAWAGARRHPFRILFHLDEVPQGVCRLTLRLVNTHYAVPPVLEVRINEGYSCRFRLPAGGGDTSLTDPKAGRPHTLSFLFSRNHLRVGENSVILIVAEGSWLLYDAISLEGGLPLPETPDVQNLSAETTMLFRRIAGELKQAVRIWLNNVGIEGEAEAGIDGFADSVQKVTLKPGENTLYLFLPPLDTWLTVWWDGRLEFFNMLHKEATLTKEAGYFAFPFRFAEPKAIKGFVELPYGILQVEKEQLPGGCREWYATHSFAALSDGRTTAYLATPYAPLLTFNDFFKGLWRGKLEGLNGSLFAYVFNNYWDTNYKASQGGEMVFGFTLNLRDEAFDPTTATHFGWESLAMMRAPSDPTNGPLQKATTLSQLPVPVAQSLLQVYPPGGTVVVGGITWEDERLCIRLYNTGSMPVQTHLEFSRWTPREAWRTDLAGRPQERLPIRSKSLKVLVPARGVVTLALR